MPETIVELKAINKTFKTSEGQDLLVLDKVDFTLKEGEIVALLGKSGSGKSTLMRIVAGLIPASTGTAAYRGKPINGPVHGASMVFQSFALLPWLTVLQNVELGLEALRVPADESRQRALKAIDMIGLDGFESAYPRELSGGMKQRVGVARALVVNPDVLVMDEPFSALDVLTAESLRGDLLDLWQQKKTGLAGIIVVTHNIAEAVALADRVLIFASNPGFVKAELNIPLAYPRDEESPAFRRLVDDIYKLMTSRPTTEQRQVQKVIDIGYRLPDVDASELNALLDNMGEYPGKIDLPELAEDTQMNVDDLFPSIEALELLKFSHAAQGDIELTAAGRAYAAADILERKEIFADHLKRYVPLAQHIATTLEHKSKHRVSEERFLSKLEDYFADQEAERVLTTAIDWGRYAELFAYDYNTRMLSLEDPE